MKPWTTTCCLVIAVAMNGPARAQPVSEPAKPADGDASPKATSVCANYREAMDEAGYPRQAIRRGLSSGKAVVEFTVRGTEVTDVRTVSASDPAFAATGEKIVRLFRCDTGVSTPKTFVVPFAWQKG